MCGLSKAILFVNGVNTDLKGSGFYALIHWTDCIKNSGFNCALFNTVPKHISAKDNLLSKIALFMYFLPGSLFRVFRIPLFELFYKISFVVFLKFAFVAKYQRYKEIIFSHHSCFYLMFLVSRCRRVLIIHDLLYVRSKSFGLPRKLVKFTFALELQIYKRCKLLCVLSYQESKLLSKFVDVKIELISVCETKLTPNNQLKNKDVAIVSDWRRIENREGVISFFDKQFVSHDNLSKFYIYGYGSTALANQLNSIDTSNLIFVDKGSYTTYNEIFPSIILVCVEKGAGIKLKVIEAICNKKYIIGTKAAFIGIPNVLLCNVAKKITCINNLLDLIAEVQSTDASFEDFIIKYNSTYRNIGVVLNELDYLNSVTNA